MEKRKNDYISQWRFTRASAGRSAAIALGARTRLEFSAAPILAG
jgi:hypothetical protein